MSQSSNKNGALYSVDQRISRANVHDERQAIVSGIPQKETESEQQSQSKSKKRNKNIF